MHDLFSYDPSPDFVIGWIAGLATALLAELVYHLLATRRDREEWKMKARGGDPLALRALKMLRWERADRLKRSLTAIAILAFLGSCGYIIYDRFPRLHQYPELFTAEGTGHYSHSVEIAIECTFARFLYWSESSYDTQASLLPPNTDQSTIPLTLIRPRFPYIHTLFDTRQLTPNQYELVVDGPEEAWQLRAECLDSAIREKMESDPDYVPIRPLPSPAETPSPDA